MGTYLRDDQCETRKLDEKILRVRPGGAAPEPLPRDASMSFSRSESREFVAVRSVTGACDDSSQTPNPGPRRQLFVAGVVKPSPLRQFLVVGVVNQSHANQMIDMSGAVTRQNLSRSVSIAETVRLARLCVLIVNPIPARRSVHPGPRRIWHPTGAALCWSLRVTKGGTRRCKSPGTREDAVVLTILSLAGRNSRDPQEGVTRAILLSGPSLSDAG
jgi:hypothetical protein